MLQGKSRLCLIVVAVCAAATAADPPIEPVSVCEVLANLPAMEGKPLAVLGRYSFRSTGLFVSEQVCAQPGPTPTTLWMVEDLKDGPRPPEHFELDAAALTHKIGEIMRHTQLGKFRFGTPDYDRWAVIYGRVELRKGEDAKKAPANLVFRGSGVVVFVTP